MPIPKRCTLKRRVHSSYALLGVAERLRHRLLSQDFTRHIKTAANMATVNNVLIKTVAADK